MFISAATAKAHVARLFSKLGARDRVQLVIIAYETGLVSPARWHQFTPHTSLRRTSSTVASRETAGQTTYTSHACEIDGTGEPSGNLFGATKRV